MFQKILEIQTPGQGLHDITAKVREIVRESGIQQGLCHVFVQHTSASLIIQENSDPAVLRDLERWMAELVPESRPWEHNEEGPDDMPAHARGAVTRTSEVFPILDAHLALGRWQALYLWEHRRRPHLRHLVISIW